MIQQPVHFIGIGGMGMSALAFLLLEQGLTVSGSDITASEVTEKLRKRGARIASNQNGASLPDRGTVVYSSAISSSNPELMEAKKRGLKLLHRSELLGELTKHHRSICVTGTHGKSTLTGMIAWMFVEAKLDPTILTGAIMKNLSSNFRAGKDPLVCEADESDRSHLNLSPFYALVTNADTDHLLNYQNIEELVSCFRAFCGKVPPEGKAFFYAGDRKLVDLKLKNSVSYGDGGTYQFRSLSLASKGTTFSLYRSGKACGKIHLGLIGRHNAENALGAAAVGLEWGLSFKEVQRGLAAFSGMKRRQEFLGKKKSIRVYDDYAHHPTEIYRTLEAFSVFRKPMTVIFQPHRYSRTEQHLSSFGKAFQGAHSVILLPIYSAGEKERPGLFEKLKQKMKNQLGGNFVCADSHDHAVLLARRLVQSHSILITMGAGDVYQCARKFLE